MMFYLHFSMRTEGKTLLCSDQKKRTFKELVALGTITINIHVVNFIPVPV